MGSEGVWGCIDSKSVGTSSFICHFSSDIAFSSSALPYAKTPISGGVWMVSGESGLCLDHI